MKTFAVAFDGEPLDDADPVTASSESDAATSFYIDNEEEGRARDVRVWGDGGNTSTVFTVKRRIEYDVIRKR